MKLSIIVAAAENRVIGRDGGLPWHLSKDLKRFKKLTLGHALVMGRKTFESIGRPLPRRRSVVLSRDPVYRPPGAETAGSLEGALARLAKEGEAEVFVIGGAEVFAEALPLAERLYLTRVHAQVGGDVCFPPFDPAAWRLVSSERHDADDRHAYPFSFEVWEREP